MTTKGKIVENMKVALLGDSVFDNGSYVSSDSESVESVLRKSGIPCQLYAVDGSAISSVYSQLEKLKPNLKSTQNIFLSVGGNNALGSLHLISQNLHLSELELFDILKEFFNDFERQLEKLYFDISEIAGKIPVHVTNIYYPCFDFTNRVSDFQGLKESGQHLKIIKIVDKLNDIIRAKVESHYFGLLDINSAFNSKKFYANEIEPSFEGSKLLAELIQRAIK